MSCLFVHDDGAYVLGALSPAERLDFEKHLAGCEDCTRSVRELAGLPGLLGRVDVSMLEHPPTEEPLPETLLPALSREVRRTRHRRRITAAALAAAVAAAVTVPVVVSRVTDDDGRQQAIPGPTATPSATPSTSAQLAMEPVGDVPVRASLSLDSVTWGTKLGLTCTYDSHWVEEELPASPTYVLYVKTRDGRSEQVGTWRSVEGETMRLSAGTAADREDIASVEVRTTTGRVLLQLTA